MRLNRRKIGRRKLWPVIIIAWGFAVIVAGFIPPFSILRIFQGILIGTIGLILLNNTLGVVPFDFWLDVIALWPVLLIAAGFAILGGVTRNKFISAMPTLIIIISLIAAFVFRGVIFKEMGGYTANEFKLERKAISGVKSGSVDMGLAVGRFKVGSTRPKENRP